MGFSFVGSAKGYYDGADSLATLTCASSLNVQEGDLLVASLEWNWAVTNVLNSIADTDGSNSFTLLTVHEYASKRLQMGYKIAAAADASFTGKATWSDVTQYKALCVYQFRPAAGAVVSFDAFDIVKEGNASTKSTDPITTTGTDEVVLASLSQYNYYNYATPTLAGANMDGQIQAPDGANGLGNLAYSIFNAIKTSIYAEWAGGSAEAYMAMIISFKAEGPDYFGYETGVEDVIGATIVAWATAGYVCPGSGLKRILVLEGEVKYISSTGMRLAIYEGTKLVCEGNAVLNPVNASYAWVGYAEDSITWRNGYVGLKGGVTYRLALINVNSLYWRGTNGLPSGTWKYNGGDYSAGAPDPLPTGTDYTTRVNLRVKVGSYVAKGYEILKSDNPQLAMRRGGR
jgi:hypothetical protein